MKPKREIELETDASDFALGGQIGQRDDDGKLHPIAFYSHKMHGAELNYPIYDKEFLAIFNCFKEFRHYLKGSEHQVKVYTDHKNIVHFTTTQELNGRQIRYAEYLSEFDFVIIHKKGSDNGRADAISRRPDFDTGTIKAKEQLLEQDNEGNYKLTRQTLGLITKQGGITTDWKTKWKRKWTSDIQVDTIGCNIQEAIGNGAKMARYNGKIQVPQDKQHELVRDIHEHPLHGHQGVTKTWKRITEHFDWEGSRKTVEEVLKKCDICARTKSHRINNMN